MAKVINSVVKMDWDENCFLTKKLKKAETDANPACKDGLIFIVACKNYEGADGQQVPVFFKPNGVFLFDRDQNNGSPSLYSKDEVFDIAKEDFKAKSASFPFNYDETVKLAIVDREPYAINFERFGIEAHKADIIARFEDIRPYGSYDED